MAPDRQAWRGIIAETEILHGLESLLIIDKPDARYFSFATVAEFSVFFFQIFKRIRFAKG